MSDASSQPDHPSEPLNPYAAPETIPDFIDDEESEEAYLRAFVGKNRSYYLSKWAPVSRGGKVQGFNIAACFLVIFWLGYRKMFLVATIVGGVALAITLAEELVLYAIDREMTPPAWDLAVNIAIAVTCGSLANRWYLWHARRQIEYVRLQGLTGPAAKQRLHKKGGTSFLWAIALPIVYMFVVSIIYSGLWWAIYGSDVFLEL